MSTKDGNQEVVYTLITPEAEPIVATIAGYINIILKIRKDKAAVITNSSGEIGEVRIRRILNFGLVLIVC